MPARASKRKTTQKVEAPVVSDPFSAAKRKKEDISKEKESTEKNKEEILKYDREEFKNPSNGKDFNFKIASWNVNGVRAWLEKDGSLDYIKAESPDICCFQELKCDKSKLPPQMTETIGYQYKYWCTGKTQGYAGVGMISKVEPINVTYELDEEEFADEGRTLIAEFEKFFLINSYIPNSGLGLVRLQYRQNWEKSFRKKLNELEEKKAIIWCGDLNVAHNEIDLKNPKTNKRTAGFTVEERQCFTDLLSDGYFDSFRFLYPDQTDAFTFWTYRMNSRAKNVGWRLDYYVMSEKLKECLVDNMIRSKVFGSDHCPIVLFLKI